jgi:hypothetical protein
MSDTGHKHLDTGHPAPGRHAIGLPLLGLTLTTAPAAWMTQLLFAFASTSYLCRPGYPGAAPNWLLPTLGILNFIALLAAMASLAIAVQLVRRTTHEHRDRSGGVLDAGEGRTRFLATWAAFISLVFIVAIFANTFSLQLVPLCQV